VPAPVLERVSKVAFVKRMASGRAAASNWKRPDWMYWYSVCRAASQSVRLDMVTDKISCICSTAGVLSCGVSWSKVFRVSQGTETSGKSQCLWTRAEDSAILDHFGGS